MSAKQYLKYSMPPKQGKSKSSSVSVDSQTSKQSIVTPRSLEIPADVETPEIKELLMLRLSETPNRSKVHGTWSQTLAQTQKTETVTAKPCATPRSLTILADEDTPQTKELETPSKSKVHGVWENSKKKPSKTESALPTATPRARLEIPIHNVAQELKELKTPSKSRVHGIWDSLSTEIKTDIPTESLTQTVEGIEIQYVRYTNESQLKLIQALIEKDLSEPYSIFTYRYFLNHWPDMTYLAMVGEICVGTIVCKLSPDKRKRKRGYIAMLAVKKEYRGKQIGSKLVKIIIDVMRRRGADMLVLETEVTNKGALALYQKLDFVRDKRLHKYYLNGVDAFRLKLWFTQHPVFEHHIFE